MAAGTGSHGTGGTMLRHQLGCELNKFRNYCGLPEGCSGIKGSPAEVTVQSSLGLNDARAPGQ